MISRLEVALRRIHLGLLWGASLLVPSWKRSEWSQEWRTELWYVLRECSSKTSLESRCIREATRFCLGAYQDAVWLRKRSWQDRRIFARIDRSAAACLLLLNGALLITWAIAYLSPRIAAGTARIQVYPWRVSDGRAAPCDCASDALDLEHVQPSLRTLQLWFDGFSHYEITEETVTGQAMPRTQWTVAHARSDFFGVLQLPVRSLEAERRGPERLPQIVLSDQTWTQVFARNPKIVGAKLHVGSVDAIVAGVTFGASVGLPGKASAWLLGSDPPTRTYNAVFVVGHVSPAGSSELGRWLASFAGIVLALLVMPFITKPSLGEYSRGSRRPSLVRRSRFWAFLIAKILLLLAIVYFASVDLDCSLVQPFSHFSGYIQVASSFALCLLGVSWAFRDQRQRCPICLRRMGHPVEVGQPSRTFLDWNGTELVCERGHFLLHIPEIPTSWFGAQRWVFLDGSWQFLFARPSRSQ